MVSLYGIRRSGSETLNVFSIRVKLDVLYRIVIGFIYPPCFVLYSQVIFILYSIVSQFVRGV